MLLKDDHEEKRRKSIKRERRKVREKGGKEAPMQMENIKMYEKTEKSEKTGKQKKFEREELLRIKHLSVTFTQYDGWFSRKTLGAGDAGICPRLRRRLQGADSGDSAR